MAEMHRLDGELLLQQGEAKLKQVGAQVEGCFLRAIELARNQRARLFELRATTSLARLYLRLRRGSEIHQSLAEICSGFSEGIDCADVTEAQRLLEEL